MFLIKHINEIDEMQFGFCSDQGTTDAIFILRQLQEKYLAKHRKLYMAFVDLEKDFDRVPQKVLWWALHAVGVPEWLVKIVRNLKSKLGCTRISIKSSAVPHSPGSMLTQILCRMSIGNALFR